jgi:hypothetical protein
MNLQIRQSLTTTCSLKILATLIQTFEVLRTGCEA